MDRYWLLTWTTYGTWLPGDGRGSVTRIRTGVEPRELQNALDTPHVAHEPALVQSGKELGCAPIFLGLAHAQCLWDQFQETARHREWHIFAVAIMRSHMHLVVGVQGDPEPKEILKSFKSYGSRALNRKWRRPESGTWWTESGSKRKLPDEAAVIDAIEYVANQPSPLLVWVDRAEAH